MVHRPLRISLPLLLEGSILPTCSPAAAVGQQQEEEEAVVVVWVALGPWLET